MSYAQGKRSRAISDRSGQAFPYKEMVREWTGALVHISEFEPKHPQIRRRRVVGDAIALQNPRAQDFTFKSGGARFTTVDLTLPGLFAFNSDGMIPDDGAAQNRARQANLSLGQVLVNSPTSSSPTVTLSTISASTASAGSVVTTANQTLVTTVASGELYLGGGATGNVYYFNGGARNMALSAPVNSTFFFNQNDGTNNNHPLIITTNSSSPNSYIVSSGITWYLDGNVTQSNYVNTTNFNAATTRYVEWTPSSTGTYYFACYVHGIGMGGVITIT